MLYSHGLSGGLHYPRRYAFYDSRCQPVSLRCADEQCPHGMDAGDLWKNEKWLPLFQFRNLQQLSLADTDGGAENQNWADGKSHTGFMPSDLRKAHQANDRAVMAAYGFDVGSMTEAGCVAELMKMYQALVKRGWIGETVFHWFENLPTDGQIKFTWYLSIPL